MHATVELRPMRCEYSLRTNRSCNSVNPVGTKQRETPILQILLSQRPSLLRRSTNIEQQIASRLWESIWPASRDYVLVNRSLGGFDWGCPGRWLLTRRLGLVFVRDGLSGFFSSTMPLPFSLEQRLHRSIILRGFTMFSSNNPHFRNLVPW